MNSANRKLHNLEECILQPLEHGSSKIDTTSIPEAERKLFEHVFAIRDKLKRSGLDSLNEFEKRILDSATQRIMMRAIDIFTTSMQSFMCNGDKRLEQIWTLRFWQFMFDTAYELNPKLERRFHTRFWDGQVKYVKRCTKTV